MWTNQESEKNFSFFFSKNCPLWPNFGPKSFWVVQFYRKRVFRLIGNYLQAEVSAQTEYTILDEKIRRNRFFSFLLDGFPIISFNLNEKLCICIAAPELSLYTPLYLHRCSRTNIEIHTWTRPYSRNFQLTKFYSKFHYTYMYKNNIPTISKLESKTKIEITMTPFFRRVQVPYKI